MMVAGARREGRIIAAAISAASLDLLAERAVDSALSSLEPEGVSAGVDAEARIPPVVVIVPIHDAFEHAQRCVAALRAHCDEHARLVLIDDASADPRVRTWLEAVARADPRVSVKLQPANLGYLETVNGAIANTDGDVVLLNSDAEVGPQWLQRLSRAAHSTPSVAIACPLSDHATLLSVVEPGEIAALDPETLARWVSETSRGGVPRLPIAVGFCMYIRRCAIEALGGFDRAFSRGYGEENDYSMRAWQRGFEVVVATDVLVRHAGAASFGSDAPVRRQRELNARLLEARWPGWSAIVRGWWRDYPLREQAERLRSRLADDGRTPVLHVAHGIARLGGAELHIDAIARALEHMGMRGTLVAPSEHASSWADLTSYESGPGLDVRAMNPGIAQPNHTLLGCGADVSDPATERTFARLLRGGGYRVVHLHHVLNWNSATLPLIAQALGVRVVLSAHDFHALCPDYNMVLRPDMRPCGKRHAGIDAGCSACLAARHRISRPDRTIALDPYLQARFAVWQRAIAAVECLIVPSLFLRDRFLRAFGPALAARIAVVPHGLLRSGQRRTRSAGRVLRAGYFGGTVRLKGFDLLVDAASHLMDAPIEFHCFGGIARSPESAHVPSTMQMHGPQPPERIADAYQHLDIVLVPSRFEESFSLVLSEAWAASVPVLVADTGALPERVVDGSDGWILPSGDVQAWVRKLRWLATEDGRHAIDRMSVALRSRPIRTISENALEYAAIYRRLLASDPQRIPARARPRPSWDVASTRLREAMARIVPAVVPEPALEPLLPDSRIAFLVSVPGTDCHELAATLDVLRSHNVQCVTIRRSTGGEVDASHERALEFALAALVADGGAVEWIVPIDAGDVPTTELAARLARHDPACVGAVYFEHGHRGSCGRYAITAKPDWDQWQALTTPYAASAVAISRRALATFDDWRGFGVATVFAAVLALARRMPIEHERVVGLWRYDANVGAMLGRRAQQAHAIASAAAAGVGWHAHPDGSGLDWALLPPPVARTPVAVRVWEGRGELIAEAALGLASRWTQSPMVLHCASNPQPFVLIARADLVATDAGWLEALVAWLVATDVDGVAALVEDASGKVGAPGLAASSGGIRTVDEDRRGLGPECAYSGVRQMHALSTACLLVRASAFLAQELDALVGPDGPASVAAQREAGSRGARFLWVGASRVRVRGTVPSGLVAAANEAAVCASITGHAAAPWRPGAWSRGAPIVVPRGTADGRRVVAFARDDWGSSQYRVHAPLAALESSQSIAPPAIWRTRFDDVPDLAGLAELRPDVVLYHLWLDDAALGLIEAQHRWLGARSIFLVDDLLTDLPVGHPMRGKILADVEARLAKALTHCDELVVTTHGLAEAYGPLARSVRVIENAIDPGRWTFPAPVAPRPPRPRLRVGWAGAAQHQRDLLLVDAVVRATAGEYDWVFLGLAPPCASDIGALVLPMVPFERYPEALAELDLDIAIAPLADDPYNRCKSALRLMELGALALPVVASPLAPYAGAPVLYADSTDTWRRRLEELAHDAPKRHAMGRALREWVLARHTMAMRVHDWRAAIAGDAH